MTCGPGLISGWRWGGTGRGGFSVFSLLQGLHDGSVASSCKKTENYPSQGYMCQDQRGQPL